MGNPPATIPRPCLASHPDPSATMDLCRLCKLFETRADYRVLWGGRAEDARPHLARQPIRPVSRISFCPARQRWDWSVTHNGQTLASGSEATEEAARDETQAILAAMPVDTAGRSVLITGGIGDVFALESMLTPDQRSRLETIYYAAPSVGEVRALMSALPNYPRLKNHVVLPSGNATHYSRHSVEQDHGPLPPGTEDWSIGTIFPRRLPFTGSSFLTYRLADPPRPPAPYVVIVPHSTWGNWPGRNFDGADWQVCLDTLDRHGLTGVVLCRERLPLPTHPRLLDWQGRTSILESVEVVKAAAGYMGVDSALSVLAAKLFPSERLAVKGFREHLMANLPAYYTPHTSFPFVRPTLEAPTWN